MANPEATLVCLGVFALGLAIYYATKWRKL